MPEENEKWLWFFPYCSLAFVVEAAGNIPTAYSNFGLVASGYCDNIFLFEIASKRLKLNHRPKFMLNVITSSQYKFHIPAKGYPRICKNNSFALLHYGGDRSGWRVPTYFAIWLVLPPTNPFNSTASIYLADTRAHARGKSGKGERLTGIGKALE